MIVSIKKLEKFGVFDAFTLPPGMREFKAQNIFYGWNYSGKTTLSKVFTALSKGTLPPEFPSARIILQTESGQITTGDLAAAAIPARVFNSDYVRDNLSWEGESFQPILLLGEETIESEKRIEVLTRRLLKYRERYAEKKKWISDQDLAIATAKTQGAKRIKQLLQLVDAFTAAHLSQQIESVDMLDFEGLAPEDVEKYMALARTGTEGVLPEVNALAASVELNQISQEGERLISQPPPLVGVIGYLKEHAEIASWVETGLTLHTEHQRCEFCEGEISTERWQALTNHFSKDLSKFKASLVALSGKARSSRVSFTNISSLSLQQGLREKFSSAWNQLKVDVDAYNGALTAVEAALASKSNDTFSAISIPKQDPAVTTALLQAIESVNSIFREHNEESKNFRKLKAEAISQLKLHCAGEFAIDEELAKKSTRGQRWKKHLSRYELIGGMVSKEIASLKAKISTAQKGREAINERITSLLGADNIQISVIEVAGQERFQLTRAGAAARNLSEGEKTAISFAFFLTQLKEIKDFSNAIIFIDDPISSLDSNHVFQVYSIIREFFFHQDGSGMWITKCRQLFISTHNFEFFSLLRKLPCNQNNSSYFMVRRLSTSTSTIENLPDSILRYPSEYHYLFSLLRDFHESSNKADIEKLLALPNAVRRFLELYTYTRIPSAMNSTVDQRAALLFGNEAGFRITKLLHHFSHLESIDRMALHTDLISDIERVIDDVMVHLRLDKQHFDALTAAL